MQVHNSAFVLHCAWKNPTHQCGALRVTRLFCWCDSLLKHEEIFAEDGGPEVAGTRRRDEHFDTTVGPMFQLGSCENAFVLSEVVVEKCTACSTHPWCPSLRFAGWCVHVDLTCLLYICAPNVSGHVRMSRARMLRVVSLLQSVLSLRNTLVFLSAVCQQEGHV